MAVPLFPPGCVVATPGALRLLADTVSDAARLLSRHANGDWGEVSSEDARENVLSVREGFRIISSCPVGDDRVWIITEVDRLGTCLLLPDEY